MENGPRLELWARGGPGATPFSQCYDGHGIFILTMTLGIDACETGTKGRACAAVQGGCQPQQSSIHTLCDTWLRTFPALAAGGTALTLLLNHHQLCQDQILLAFDVLMHSRDHPTAPPNLHCTTQPDRQGITSNNVD
eukprot:1153432-Pelagomonas_calceolata.AAC.2